MAHYQTIFIHIKRWILDLAVLYRHISILCTVQYDKAAANLVTLVRDWSSHICTNTSRRKNLPIVSSRSGILRKLRLVFYEIRRRYHCLFKQGFGPRCKAMDYKDQQCLGLGLFLLELKRHRENSLKDNNTATQAHQQRAITTFFSPITPTHAVKGYINRPLTMT